MGSVAQGPKGVILAATERARRGSLARRKAERVPVQPVAYEVISSSTVLGIAFHVGGATDYFVDM